MVRGHMPAMVGKGRTAGRLGKRVWKNWELYLLLLPAVVYLFIFCYMPMYGVQIAFKNFMPNRGINGSPWVGLKHFVRFMNLPSFGQIIWNTLSISLYITGCVFSDSHTAGIVHQ